MAALTETGSDGLRIRKSTPMIMMAPALIVLGLVLILPLTMLLSRSIFDPDFTLQHYARALSTSAYLEVFWISFEISFISTAVCLLIGYPTAYVLSQQQGTTRAILIGFILLPFWTNILVRCYAWIILLQTRGIVNMTLVDWLHVIPQPIPLVFNFAGVIIGMVHYLLPPAILILDSVMRTIDPRLVAAAQSLGATPRRAFYRVFLPLTMPGIRAATILIFIMGLGFFVTPALLGGRRELTISMLINVEFTEMINWGFGSALAVALLVITMFFLYLYYLFQPQKSLGA